MRHQVKSGLFLLIISTMSYYVPALIVDLKGYDLSKVPPEFYKFYCYFTSSNLFLISVYALYLFLVTDSKHYKIKIIFFYMSAAELYTFINHVANKFYKIESHDGVEMLVTLVVFGVCATWFFKKALFIEYSDNYQENETYIVKFKPKNISGIFNYIWNSAGHKSIYQSGKLYKFSRRTKRVRECEIDIRQLILDNQIVIKKRVRIKNIEKLVDKRFNLFLYNCNHLANER